MVQNWLHNFENSKNIKYILNFFPGFFSNPTNRLLAQQVPWAQTAFKARIWRDFWRTQRNACTSNHICRRWCPGPIRISDGPSYAKKRRVTFQSNKVNIEVPYARHYKPRLVFFLPNFHFGCGLYCRQFMYYKNGNSSFFKLKIRGL